MADVVHGRLRAGDHLVTQELAQRFGVSHTPIREALIALAGVGVIDLLPNRGAVVRRVSPKEVREVCQVRRGWSARRPAPPAVAPISSRCTPWPMTCDA